MTYSVIAVDPVTGDLGGAVQSKFLAVGAMVLYGSAGAGMVATQALAQVSFGPRGVRMMREGASAGETLKVLLLGDDTRERRQVAAVDAAGRSAAHTGTECMDWAGHREGQWYACQGNGLASPEVVESMAAVIEEREDLEFPERLVAALNAAQSAGGDARGQQSAALLVIRAGAGYGGASDRFIDLRVDDNPSPIGELSRLLDLHRLYFRRPSDDDLIAIDDSLAKELSVHLSAVRGHEVDAGSLDELWDELDQWAGKENYEERMVKRGYIDTTVLEKLREQAL